MAIKKLRLWLFPLVWLLGFVCAWGTILVDRQMLIDEQRQLQEKIDSVKIELKITKMIDEYGDDWQEMVIWNEEAVTPKEVGK